MAETPPPVEAPANQSPETMIEEPPTVAEIAGATAEAVFDRFKAALPGSGASAGAAGESAPPVVEAPAAGHTDPPPAPASAAPAAAGAVESVESAVERALSRRDADARLAAVEERTEPPKPKPPRVGIAAFLFGKDRTS